jgi:hypothetical protein
VQRAVRELDIRYAIIGTGLIGPARDHAPGMHHLDRVSALELVFSNGSAWIYAVNGPLEAETE